MDLGHWEFDGTFDPNDWFGFVYRIIDLTTTQEYIGKKQFHTTNRKSVKGRKNKKIVKKESNWKTYTSSSTHINTAIEEKGKENFRFIIETLHKTKGSLTYAEVERQVLENVLREKLDDGVTPKYYNKMIAAVKFVPAEELTEEHKVNISNSLRKRYSEFPYWKDLLTNEEYDQYLNRFYRGKNNHLYRCMSSEEREQFLETHVRGQSNPMYEKESKFKGMTFKERHGSKSENIRLLLSEKCGRPGDQNGMYGKSHSEETKQKWSEDPRRKHTGTKNGMYNTPCYYKMNNDEKAQWRGNISKATKGKPKPTVTCPHCGKSGGKPSMTRFHFDNCKSRPTI